MLSARLIQCNHGEFPWSDRPDPGIVFLVQITVSMMAQCVLCAEVIQTAALLLVSYTPSHIDIPLPHTPPTPPTCRLMSFFFLLDSCPFWCSTGWVVAVSQDFICVHHHMEEYVNFKLYSTFRKQQKLNQKFVADEKEKTRTINNNKQIQS